MQIKTDEFNDDYKLSSEYLKIAKIDILTKSKLTFNTTKLFSLKS